jgi:hypothetical protein
LSASSTSCEPSVDEPNPELARDPQNGYVPTALSGPNVLGEFVLKRLIGPITAAVCSLVTIGGCGDDAGAPADAFGEADASGADVDTFDDAEMSEGDGFTEPFPDADAALALGNVNLIENPLNVLSVFVNTQTNLSATLSVEVTHVDSGDSVTVDSTGEAGRTHEVIVLGLYADTDYTFTVTADDGAGGTDSSGAQAYTTSALPTDFPEITVNLSEPENMEPGITVFTASRWNPSLDSGYGYIVAVDETGETVWYYRTGLPFMDLTTFSSGNLAYIFGLHGINEIDFYGNIIQTTLAVPLGGADEVQSFHHHVSELENGNILTIGTEIREIDGYPLDGGGTTSYWVVADTIEEWTRADDGPSGTVVNIWPMFDHYDPLTDLSEEFHDTFWDVVYAHGDIDTTKDWMHVNEVLVDPSDDHFILSVRHMDDIIKLDREENEILWTLAHDGDFTMEEGGEWQYHQHAPELQDNGNLLIYDNGNGRPDLDEGQPPYTRVVEFALDFTNPDDLRVEQLWEYTNDEPYFAPFVGGATRLANGNILITDGGVLEDPHGRETDPDNHRYGRIVEISFDGDVIEKVFEIVIGDVDSDVGYNLYQSLRLDSLYP